MGSTSNKEPSMSRKSKLIAVFAVLSLVASVVVIGAIGATGGGTADQVKFKTGANASTPSGSFIDVPGASFSVTPAAGPLVIRFSASGTDQDFNSGGGFAGHTYAAMVVRVLVNGSQVGPAVRFFDNAGKVGVQKPRPTTTSYEWAKTVSGGPQNVKVQFKNLHTFDNANIDAYTLSVQYG
jgi:hypothetical protein